MKIVKSVIVACALCPGFFIEGCSKSPAGAPQVSAQGRSARPARAKGNGTQSPILTREEVGAVLGQPVTSVEGKGTHLTYKTDAMLVEATIEVDDRDDAAEAILSMNGARKATGFLGGQPEAVPGLGDEAFFGAMSTLYLRKGAAFALVQAPNLAQQASMKQMEKVQAAKSPEEMAKAMEELKALTQGSPGMAGLQEGDAKQGALAAIKASSKKQGTDYEARQRAMAVSLATRLVAKL